MADSCYADLSLVQVGGKEAAGKRLGYMEAMVRLLQQTQSGALEDERWDLILVFQVLA